MQGEDVVAGIRTPEDLDAMKDHMPEAYEELVENCDILESHYKDMMVSYSNLFPFPFFFIFSVMYPFYTFELERTTLPKDLQEAPAMVMSLLLF
jgi:hypothetical protein